MAKVIPTQGELLDQMLTAARRGQLRARLLLGGDVMRLTAGGGTQLDIRFLDSQYRGLIWQSASATVSGEELWRVRPSDVKRGTAKKLAALTQAGRATA